MTREEAAKRWEWVIENFNDSSVYLWPDQRQELLASIALLRGPQPDPDTGLVPCGCGGKAGFHYSVMMRDNDCYVECGICGGHTKVVLSEDKARDAWNTAMGWKGGAE